MKKTNKIFFTTLLYASALIIWLALNKLTGEHFWWMTVLNAVVPYLFIPALPLALLVATQPGRQRFVRTVAALIIPLVIFLLLYWPYVLPRPPIPVTPPVLSVMTYNILFSNENYDAIAAVIRTQQPDLVALQEVQPAAMAALQSRLQKQYPYTLLATPHPYGTTAILSRHAFIDTHIVGLHADRPALVVKIKVAGQEITFATAHLLAYGLQWVPWYQIPAVMNERTQAQNLQTKTLLAVLDKVAGSVILACDCNSKEANSSYQLLAQRLTNVVRQLGWRLGASHSSAVKQDRDLQHIDYIFYKSNQLQPVDAYKTQDAGGSDHLPLIALFNMTK